MNMKDVKAITIPECIVANNSQTFSSTSNTSSNTWFNYYPTSTTALGSCKTIRIKGKFHVYGNSYSWLGVWYNSNPTGDTTQITLNTGSGWVETPFDITCYLVNDDWVNNTLWNVFAFGGGSSNYRWIRAVVAKNNNNNLDFYTQSDTTNEYFRVTVDSIEMGVKEIKDSNGNVIWGSESAFPYRRLEYIKFSGAESVHISYNPYNGMRWELTFKMNKAVEGYSGAAGSGPAYHCSIGGSNSGYVGGWFLGAYREYSAYPSTNKNTVILDRYQGKVWINNTLVYTGTGSYGSTTSRGMNFGARIDNAGDLGFYMNCNIYSSKISNGGRLIAEYFPAQRKSDGVCGLYRTSDNTFYPMTGTTITDNAAGPIVDEYWNLTAPSN